MSGFADQVLPFSVGGGGVRGRLARLGPALDTILDGQHGYPAVIGSLLGQTAVLAAVLANVMKFDGIFTLQAQGDGPVSLLVADITSDGHLRAHARFNAERLDGLGQGATIGQLLGKGYLAFTVDQGPDTDRYQGIVELTGDSLADCAQEYFSQSEQLETRIQLAIAEPAQGQGWRAAALMIQRMPANAATAPILVSEDAEEGWRRAAILMGSTKEAELLDPALAPGQLLYRLYHADQLQVFDPKPVEAKCRCSRDRVLGALRSLPQADLAELASESGAITVTCEFCRADHTIPLAELTRP
jgi:molecular chaperone Hsp33